MSEERFKASSHTNTTINTTSDEELISSKRMDKTIRDRKS